MGPASRRRGFGGSTDLGAWLASGLRRIPFVSLAPLRFLVNTLLCKSERLDGITGRRYTEYGVFPDDLLPLLPLGASLQFNSTFLDDLCHNRPEMAKAFALTWPGA